MSEYMNHYLLITKGTPIMKRTRPSEFGQPAPKRARVWPPDRTASLLAHIAQLQSDNALLSTELTRAKTETSLFRARLLVVLAAQGCPEAATRIALCAR